MELGEIRNALLKSIGFDLYQSPRFIECMVCHLGELQQTSKQEVYDGETENGIRVEIKHSNIVSTTRCDGKPRRYFRWEKLQGTSGLGKDADVYVLVGFDDLDDMRPFTFLVIPALVVGNRTNITLSLDERIYRGSNEWAEFGCHIDCLHETIRLVMMESLC